MALTSGSAGGSVLRSGLLRLLVGAVSVAMVVTLAPVSQAATPSVTPAATGPVAAAGTAQSTPSVSAPPVESRPDAVSAEVTAKAQGARVEVEDLRTETSSTWANPDGTWTTEQHGGPIRFRDAKGDWVPVDLNIESNADGTAGAVGHADGLSLAGRSAAARRGVRGTAGTDAVAVDEKSGRGMTLTWPGALPAPALKGQSATYTNAAAGVDLVVHPRRSGFESDVVIKSAAARDALAAKAGAKGVSFSFPLKTPGLTARSEADGSVSFVDGKGSVVSWFAPPVAWDATVDPHSGNHVNVSPVAMSVTQRGSGRATLTLTPDAAWLASPDRVFPVTIDPTYVSGANVAPTFDTYVSSMYPTAAYSTDTELRVGTYNGGADKYRSFLTFPLATLKKKDVVSASLSLYEFHSWSCTPTPFYVYSAGGTTTATNWNNQPAAIASYGSLTTAKGYASSCAAGRVLVPVTSLVQKWAGSTAVTGGIRLHASETDNSGWKKFYSVETSQDPFIVYTYNRPPNVAAAPTVAAPAHTYTPPGGAPKVFTSDSTPAFTSSATDPDGSKVRITFEVHRDTTGTTMVSTCETGLVASGTPASCAPSTVLTENGSAQSAWYVRASVRDDRGVWNGTWSPWTTFFLITSPPPAATVTCDQGYDDGVWTDDDPAGTVSCALHAAGVSGTLRAPGYLDISVDGVVKPRLTITPTNSVGTVHVTYPFQPSARGYHEVKVTPIGRSLRVGPTTTYGFGWGSASLSRPDAGTASTGKIRVQATSAPRGSAAAVSAAVQWRIAGSGNELTGWTDAAAGESDITPTSSTAPVQYGANFDLTSAIREAGAATDIPSRIPVRLDVQVCFTYTGTSTSTVQCTWSESPVTVTRLPHAFGAGYPVADAGIGQLAQFTGEISLSDTDVSVPGYTGDISISRSHTSFDGDGQVAAWPSDPVTGVFGPGFTANLDGGDAGLAGLQVVDNTGLDGSIAFLDEQGEPLVYVNPAGTRAYPAPGTDYVAGTDETLASGTRLTITGSGSATVLTLTEQDGTATTWEPTSAPSTAAATVWRPATISEPGQAGQTTFGHDPVTGRVTRIVAPVPDGMSGASCPTSGALTEGCRALDITYATATTATSSTPGDVVGQVASISSELWDPAASAMATTLVATYTYDTSGRLRSVTDPRTGLSTTYTWTGATTRLASVTSDGLAGTDLSYDATGRLIQVSRQAAQAGGPDVVTHRFVYDVPTSGSGLPDVHDAVTDYRQAKAPVIGYAAFGQDYTGPVADPGVDWTYADLSYVDDLGYTVNTASYGAGQWLITSTDYDDHDNVVRALDASAAATARANPDWDGPQVDALSTQTLYNTEVKNAAGDIVLPGGSRVTDTFGPSRMVALSTGEQMPGRPHTRTVYDEGAPNGDINPATGQQYSLPTTVTTGVADSAATPDAADMEVYSTVTSGYDKLNASDATEGDGWALGVATRTTTKDATTAGDITKVSRYDTMGRVTETRQPLSTGADAGTTLTAYYTVAAQVAPNVACGGRPEWAGLVCRTYLAAQPAGQPMPDQTTTAYSMWLDPVTQVETSGTATRTTATGYDSAGRQISSKTIASGITGSVPRAGTYTRYDPATGLVAYTGWLNAAGDDAEPAGRTTTTYDRWGRAVSQVGYAGTVTTSYDAAGRVGSVTDAKGTTSYGYDGTDERRGLVTSMTVSRGGSAGDLTYQADYDADGNLTRQTQPGGITKVSSFDEGGQLVGLQYLGQVTPVTAVTDPASGQVSYVPGTPEQDQPWLVWTLANDGAGRVRLEQSGSGAAYDDGDGVATIDDVADWTDAVGQATAYQRDYRYDYAGRLVFALDAASAPAAATPTTACVTRTYAFDKNGRRTSRATTTRPGPDCTATGTTITTTAGGYDTADRPVTGGGGAGSYVYDQFGRQTTIPAADAPNPAGGAITASYYDDDLAQAVAQGGTSTTFTLDAAGRRSVQTTTDSSGTTTTTREYTDDGDDPAWIDTAGPAGTTTTRYTEGIGDDLSASIATDGAVVLSLSDPHGDVVTTVDIPATQTGATPAAGIDGWADYTEYGTPATTSSPAAIATVSGAAGYGWLGAKQRSTTDATVGLTLMGVRLYDPETGQFTSLDPVAGGNTTGYAYPQDPINMYDLNGMCLAGLSWACKAAKWTWNHRSRIVHTAVGIGASAVAGAVAVGICGASAGIGCVVMAGVMTRVAIGSVAHPIADRMLGHRTNGRDVLRYAVNDAVGGGIAGVLKGSYGRGVGGLALAKLRGKAAAKPGYSGSRSMIKRNPWEHRR